MKSQRITKVIAICHLGTMNVCMKFYILCLTYWWRYRKSKEITKIIRIHLLGILDICTECMAMYPIAVETFHSFIS